MSASYQLKNGVQLLALEENTALLSHFGRRIWIEMPGLEKILPAVLEHAKTPFTPESVRKVLPSTFSQDETTKLLETLLSGHLLLLVDEHTSGFTSRTPGLQPFLQSFTDRADLVDIWSQIIEETDIEVLTTEQLAKDQLKFGNLKIGSVSDSLPQFSADEDKVYVLFTSVHRFDYAMKVNRQAANTGATVLPVICDSSGAFIGPILGPEGQPCLECWWTHRQAHFKTVDWKLYRHSGLQNDESQKNWPAHFWNGLNYHLENELMKILIEHLMPQSLYGCVILDFFNGSVGFENLHRRPGCLICKTPIKGLL